MHHSSFRRSRNQLAWLVAFAAAITIPALAQEDAIGVPGPLTFEGTDFALAWNSHPDETYYKQEYVPTGQAVESYTEMFMIDVVTTGTTPEDAAQGMIAALDERKKTDLAVNYDMIANDATGEVILDFLLTDSSTGTVIVEWNAYRYAPLGDGVVLYAISRRGYDDEATAFLTNLKDWRQGTISALAMMDAPAITLAD